MNAICTGRQDLDLRPFLAAVVDESLSVLKILVGRDRLTVKPAGIERRAVSRGNNAHLRRRHNGRRSDRDPEEIWMYRPLSGRKRSQLDTFHTALFDERYGILKIVVCILR